MCSCAELPKEEQLAEGLKAFHSSGQRDQAALLAAAEFSFTEPDMAEVKHPMADQGTQISMR